MRTIPLLSAFSCLIATSVVAGPLSEARINKIINEVSVVDPAKGARKAALQEVIKDEIGVKTGIKSRSELLFQDDTLTRIGPESYFSFKPGTRDLSLQQGTMLLQVPKGLGGARIRTAAVTASITGTTIMLENIPGKHFKVLVLEGSLRLSMKGTFGDSLLLLPGKMVIMPPNAKRIPDPVSVDLARVMKTSALVKMDKSDTPLPSLALIETEIAMQEKSKIGNTLVDTNLVILGNGTSVIAASDDVIDALSRKDGLNDVLLAANGPSPTPIPAATPLPTATPIAITTPVPTATPLPSATPLPTATPGTSPTPGDDDDDGGEDSSPAPTPGEGSVAKSDGKDITITKPIWTGSLKLNAGKDLKIAAWIAAKSVELVAGKTATISASIYAESLDLTAKDLKMESPFHVHSITLDVEKSLTLSSALVAPARRGTIFSRPADGSHLTLYVPSLDLTPLSNGGAPISLAGGNASIFSLFPGGSGGSLDIGDSSSPTVGPINISAPVTATSGRNGFLNAFGGAGGTVNAVSKDTITVNSTVKVSDSAAPRASSSGGKISLESRKTSGTAIKVTSSAQLLSLLANAAPGKGGSIKFTSAGGTIDMSGTAKADRGTIDIRNTGSNGIVNLTNATLHGDVIKAGALGSNGTLNVGGGTLNADSTIKLYADGSNGTVNFTDNVTLSGTSVKTISGNTVTVFDGKVVTVSGPGPANVFTNRPNYSGSGGNNSTTGTFGGKGATTQPFSARPGG